MHQLRRHLHAAHGLNVWYATAMGLCGCLGLLLLGFISYWCFMLRQDSRRRRSVVLLSNRNSYESSHLLQRASLDWPSSMTTSSMMTLPLSSSSTSLYLSPIPEELRSMCSEDVRDEFDDFNRDKEFVQDFCDQSEYVRLSIHSISIPRLHTYLLHHRDYVWLDKPALYMGKNRSKRMYLLGRATSSLAQLTSRGRLGGGGESKHVLCSLFPTTAAAMQAEDLSALRAFFHYVQEQCPHVLPVLGIHLVPSTDKVMVLTPYVPQGSLKDYIYHRCKTAVALCSSCGSNWSVRGKKLFVCHDCFHPSLHDPAYDDSLRGRQMTISITQAKVDGLLEAVATPDVLRDDLDSDSERHTNDTTSGVDWDDEMNLVDDAKLL
ncbi:hypothetical protein DYB26_011994, partial [Aphanomyces astaci]